MPKIRDERDIEYYKKKYNLVFLEDEIEHIIIDIWLFARVNRMEGVEIKDNRVELMCKRHKLDLLDTLRLIEQIERESE